MFTLSIEPYHQQTSCTRCTRSVPAT